MTWSKIIVAGVAAGFVANIADFIMHGLILGNTYTKYPVFSQEQANPLLFLAVSICIGIIAAMFYARTVDSWAGGWKGGATFGFFIGLVHFFSNHYHPLVLDGFPYYLSWCWGGTGLISAVIAGAVIGAIYTKPQLSPAQ
jgi:cellobiose-specific phosphotransferase system component IIC